MGSIGEAPRSSPAAPRVVFAMQEPHPLLEGAESLSFSKFQLDKLEQRLRAAGAVTAQALWRDPAVRWGDYDVVLPLAIWDYGLYLDEFRAWLRRLDALGVYMLNPPSMMEQFIAKSYLFWLQKRGVPIADTEVLMPEDSQAQLVDKLDALRARGHRNAILKPVGGCYSLNAHKVSLDDEEATLRLARASFSDTMGDEGMLLQEYIPTITSHGEWSVVFVNGHECHAFLKKPTKNCFLGDGCDYDFEAVPPAAVTALARQTFNALPSGAVFGRVDMMLRPDGRPLVSEVEGIAPGWLCGVSQRSVDELAAAVLDGWQAGKSGGPGKGGKLGKGETGVVTKGEAEVLDKDADYVGKIKINNKTEEKEPRASRSQAEQVL